MLLCAGMRSKLIHKWDKQFLWLCNEEGVETQLCAGHRRNFESTTGQTQHLLGQAESAAQQRELIYKELNRQAKSVNLLRGTVVKIQNTQDQLCDSVRRIEGAVTRLAETSSPRVDLS